MLQYFEDTRRPGKQSKKKRGSIFNFHGMNRRDDEGRESEGEFMSPEGPISQPHFPMTEIRLLLSLEMRLKPDHTCGKLSINMDQ